MEKDNKDFQNRYEDGNQNDTDRNIFINPDRTSAWSQKLDDDDSLDDDLEWEDAEYDDEDE